MATNLQVYSVSQIEAIRDYLDNLVVTTGIYMYELEGQLFILDW